MSLVEAVANVVVGYARAVGVQTLVFPLFGLEATLRQSLGIGAIFTLVSLVRGYLLRRVFPGGAEVDVLLEHFGVRLNCEGFPRTVCRDLNCMLEREASVHGSIPFR